MDGDGEEEYRFLPVWEGVSFSVRMTCDLYWFPPCMGGCIAL